MLLLQCLINNVWLTHLTEGERPLIDAQYLTERYQENRKTKLYKVRLIDADLKIS